MKLPPKPRLLEMMDGYDLPVVEAWGRACALAALEAAAEVAANQEKIGVVHRHPARVEFVPDNILARKIAALISSIKVEEK